MIPILVDSDIILDVATRDPRWAERSGQALAEGAEHARLVINPIIFAEVSVGYARVEELEASLRGKTCLGPPPSWPGNASWPTGAGEVRKAPRCPTSTSAPMRPWPATGCSRGMQPGTRPISPGWRSSCPEGVSPPPSKVEQVRVARLKRSRSFRASETPDPRPTDVNAVARRLE